MTMLDTASAGRNNKKQERQYLRTNDDQKTDQKPVDSMFESDKDTAAASEQPAKGDAPLPTQEGKDTPDIGLQERAIIRSLTGDRRLQPTRAAKPRRKLRTRRKRNRKRRQIRTDDADSDSHARSDAHSDSHSYALPTPTPHSLPQQPTPTTPDVVPTDEEMAMLSSRCRHPTPTPMPTPMPTPSRKAQAIPSARVLLPRLIVRSSE